MRTKVTCALSQSEYTRRKRVMRSSSPREQARSVEARTVTAVVKLATSADSRSLVSLPIDSSASVSSLRKQADREGQQREDSGSTCGAAASRGGV